MNKKSVLVVIAVIVIVLVVWPLIFKNPKTTNPAASTQPAPVQTTVSSANSTEAIEGTIKSLITSGKTIVCTYTHQLDTTTVSGKVYVTDGKMRGDFISVDSAKGESVNSHVIIADTQYAYAWTDLINRGLKVPLTANISSASNIGGPDFDQQVQFSCQAWTPDSSLFVIPSDITFSLYHPAAQPKGQASPTP